MCSWVKQERTTHYSKNYGYTPPLGVYGSIHRDSMVNVKQYERLHLNWDIHGNLPQLEFRTAQHEWTGISMASTSIFLQTIWSYSMVNHYCNVHFTPRKTIKVGKVERTCDMGVVSSSSTLLRLIFKSWSFWRSGTLYTIAPIPLKITWYSWSHEL